MTMVNGHGQRSEIVKKSDGFWEIMVNLAGRWRSSFDAVDGSDCFRPAHPPGGFAGTGQRRLITAHTPSGHSIGIVVRR